MIPVIKKLNNTKHEKPMAGDLVKVWVTNDKMYASGVLAVVKGELNTKLSTYDILLEPQLPINVKNGFIDVKNYAFEIKNINTENLSIVKGQPTKKMLFEEYKKPNSRLKKLSIFVEVKLFKINL